MNRMEAIAWVLSVVTDLRLSQTKTLSELVAAALHVGRVSLSAIGRCLLGSTTAKSRIQRTWRFTANRGVVVSDAMRGVVRRLLKRRRKKPLLVAFDCTDIRGFCTLMAAAVMKGRAVPFFGQLRVKRLKRRTRERSMPSRTIWNWPAVNSLLAASAGASGK